MTALRWLYRQFVGSIPSGAHQCYLCGAPCPGEHSIARGIADTFNSHHLALAPSSHFLCAACFWYLDSKSNHPDFRKMSLVITKTSWHNWQRPLMKQDITRWLTDGLHDDAYLVVSLSKKKHILLQAPNNAAGSRHLAIQVEEQVAHLTLSIWQELDTPFTALLQLGHGKGEILSGHLSGSILRKHGRIGEAFALSRQLELWRNSPQLELLSYVTMVEEK